MRCGSSGNRCVGWRWEMTETKTVEWDSVNEALEYAVGMGG